MKSSKFFNGRTLSGALKIFALCFVAVLIAATVFAFGSSAGFAYADENVDEPIEDTFSVVFPTVSYLQSDNPTLISANDKYLIIYDETLSMLFVCKEGQASAYSYPLEIESVKYIRVLGNTAFIYADGISYTLDLSNPNASPVLRQLNTPQNATYFHSDGKYLYVKSTLGYISIYDEHMDIALGIDNRIYFNNKGESVFSGSQAFAGNNGMLHYFALPDAKPYYIVYDPTTSTEITNTAMNCFVTEAYLGDIIFAQVNTNTTGTQSKMPLAGIDKTTGALLFTSDIVPDSFCAYEDKLYTIEGKQIVTYSIDTNDDGEYCDFKKESTISMAGSDSYHLNEPKDIIKSNGNIIVADSANMRLSFIGSSAQRMNTMALGVSPLRLAGDSSSLFVLCSDERVLKIEGDEIIQTYDASGTLDIEYLGKLYMLKADGLYSALGGSIYPLAQIYDGKRIACAKDGTNLYVLADDGIHILSGDGKALAFLEGDFTDALDFAVDYAGNVFVLYQNRIDTYSNAFGSLALVDSMEFHSTNAYVTANSMCIDAQNVYFTADECLVGKANVSAVTKDTYEAPAFVPSQNETYRFAKLKEGARSYIIPVDGRMDGIKSAYSDTIIVLDDARELSDGYRYALLDGEFFIIIENDYDEVQTEPLDGEFYNTSDTVLYTLPDVEAGSIEIAQNTVFGLISDCADYDGGKWLRVSYENRIYFIDAEVCEKYIREIPEDEKTYGRAKAGRIGGLVNIYEQPYEGASSLTQIVDGTTVEVLDEFEYYYMVKYEDTIGFMLKEEVKIGGLTTVQIVAIVLAVFVVIAGTCIFIAIQLVKKKSDEQARKKK